MMSNMADTLAAERDEEIAKCAKRQEIMAAGEYAAHIMAAQNPKLVKILVANQKDEIEDHAKKLNEWLKQAEAKEHKLKV